MGIVLRTALICQLSLSATAIALEVSSDIPAAEVPRRSIPEILPPETIDLAEEQPLIDHSPEVKTFVNRRPGEKVGSDRSDNLQSEDDATVTELISNFPEDTTHHLRDDFSTSKHHAVVPPTIVNRHNEAVPGHESYTHHQNIHPGYQSIHPGIPTDALSLGRTTGGPSMLVSVDALLLGRHMPVEGPFLFDQVTLEPLLDLSELNDGAEPGVRLSVVFCEDDSPWATEFSFFGLEKAGAKIRQENNNPIIYPFFGGVPANPLNTVNLKYTSKFHGMEVNRRKALSPRITGLFGFRFIELREEFDIFDDNGIFESLADNDLYGIQIGGEFLIKQWGCTNLVGTVKSGIYYNNADVRGTAVNPGTGAPMRFIDDEDTAVHVSEVMLGLSIPMGPQGNFRIGYEFIYLDGVGLAPNQNSTYSIFTGQGSLNTSEVWYHGGFLGIELFW